MPVEDTHPPRASPLRRLHAGAAGRIESALGWLVLRGHRIARDRDLVPQEFGLPDGLDEDDPKAVRAEWLRQLRLWADYNPEEVFALKVGGSLLFGAVAALWLLIGAMD